ncbi:MAG: hypothetical protein IJ899_20500 [Blautia sp.]|nr:hypothetical protein [Blautia sp.]MBR2561869.1 hypothetical protein [Eubacterium sp.]
MGSIQSQDQWNEIVDKIKMTVADLSETVQIAGMVAKDELEKRLADAKSDLVAAQENIRIMSERKEGKWNSMLIKMQMLVEEAKKELEAKKAEAEAKDKATAVEYLKRYAEECNAMAILLVEEANEALLEAKSMEE